MKKILLIILFALSIKSAHAYQESYYQDIYCDLVEGEKEVILDDKTRVDWLTKEYAIELDFTHKAYECGFQALHYAYKTNRKPLCVLIGNKKDYDKNAKRLKDVAKHYLLPLEVNWIEK